MRILCFAKAYPPEIGGVETYSERVAMNYARVGHDVTVVTAHPGARGKEQRGNVTVFNVGQGGGQLGVFRRMLFQLWKMRQQSFDIAHATTWRVALPVMLMRRRLPVTVTIHGHEVFVAPRLLRPLMIRILRRAKHVPVVSKPMLDQVMEDLGFDLPAAFVNWNGISFDVDSLSPQGKPPQDSTRGIRLLCVCRLVNRKNVHGAIRAVAQMVAKGYKIEFLIIGGGEDTERLKALIDELGVQEHARMLGPMPHDDIRQFYESSHIFLHPQTAPLAGQDIEAFGLVIADAMAFRCVPVAGASGGPLDFVQHGETGMLVDGEDTDAIARAVEFLIDHPQKRDAMANAAHVFACKHLTWDAHAEKILARAGHLD